MKIINANQLYELISQNRKSLFRNIKIYDYSENWYRLAYICMYLRYLIAKKSEINP